MAEIKDPNIACSAGTVPDAVSGRDARYTPLVLHRGQREAFAERLKNWLEAEARTCIGILVLRRPSCNSVIPLKEVCSWDGKSIQSTGVSSFSAI